jgi:D-serine deaminase-like pyridoxal phosphate-dependent protein
VILDNPEAARIVAARGEALGIRFPVLIEIDSDNHRSGVKPADRALLEIGSILDASRGADLRGVMTHAGESYHCDTVEKIRAMAIQECDAVVQCAARLTAASLPCPVVSVGSTPTATYSEDLTGVTEVRAGVYVFFDLVMAGISVCAIDDIALSVLCTVIGHQLDKGWIIVDGGWMALSSDRGTKNQKVDQGYGMVWCKRQSGRRSPGQFDQPGAWDYHAPRWRTRRLREVSGRHAADPAQPRLRDSRAS